MITEKDYVTYSDFGAIGDGVANDFEAMLLTHEYANEHHLSVKGESDKQYRIHTTEKDGEARSIIIKTHTDWCGATIIIDDTDIEHKAGNSDYKNPIIKILPYEETISLSEEIIATLPKITRETKKLDLGLGYPAMVVLYNDEVRHYIRHGSCANNGSPQHELFILDKDGNIDPSTPFMYDYDKVTHIDVIKTEIEPLVVENGIFRQRASHIDTVKILPDGTRKNMNRAYFHRNIEISRSNTTVRKIEHYISGEITIEEQARGMYGPAYRGFLAAISANNVTIEDCVLTARRNYAPGTYAFSASLSNNVVLRRCTQSNYYKKDENGNPTKVLSTEVHPLTKRPEYWGIGGSGFCKNMVYDSCKVTRYDAHQGLCNGRITNCHISMINLVGAGEMIIENTTIESAGSTIANLRRDYGSTWNGVIRIKNCTVDFNEEVSQKKALRVFNFGWVNHFFGYICHFPSIEIDNLKFTRPELSPVQMIMFKNTMDYESPETETNIHLPTLADGTKNENPTVPPKFFRVINNEQGLEYALPDVPFFENTELEGIKKVPPFSLVH